MTTIATRRPVLPDRALPWAGLLAVLAVFELLARTELINPRFFPPVSEMVVRLVEEAGTGEFWTAVGNTLQGWALGLGIACAIAVPVGIVDRLQPAAVSRAARRDRVPAPDPVRRADPARRARVRLGPGEQGVPRGVRRDLAAADADALRRAGRRPGGDGHRALVRLLARAAAAARDAAQRRALRRHRRADLRRRGADPRRHRRAGDRRRPGWAARSTSRARAATSS